MAEKLTPQQYQAVHDRGGKLLVSAAAGSGKTKVLVDRLMTYLQDPVDPANLDEFLIITYTKAAASELRGKIAAKLTEQIALNPENRHLQKQMQRLFLTKISTVHGFCSDLLREFAYKLDLAPDFRVADESECREIRDMVLSDLLERSYEKLGSDPDFLSFVDSQGLGRDDRFVPEILEKVYDSARCHLDPEAWLKKCFDASDVESNTDISKTPWGKYLIDDLQSYLEVQIRVLRSCLQSLKEADGMEKPTGNIQSTLSQLQELHSANSWDDIVSRGNVDYGRLTFPRKNADTDLTERVKAARNACKKGLERKLHSFSDDSQQILQDMRQSSSSVRGLIGLVKQFEKDYHAAKRIRRVLDFSDLEHKTLDLLLGKSRSYPTASAMEIGRRYREIMVDEYQDSNAVQDAIFDALTCAEQNCFLVGDVKQSIYQFRLADPGIFLEKYQSYVDAEHAQPKQGRKVLLSHNFRSGPEIIGCVNDVFSQCMSPKVGGLHYGEAEALREGIPRDPLSDTAVELYALDAREDTYVEEAAFVASRIQTMLQEQTLIRNGNTLRPVKPGDIVILLRSPGSAGKYFVNALEALGIRCTTGAGADLLQAEEIGILRAFLQTILNPRQDIPLIRVLASPVFGFTANDLAAIRSREKKGPIYDVLLQNDMPKVKNFLEILGTLRQEARMGTITELLESCFRLTKLDSIFSAMLDGDLRFTNLQTFYQLASDYEKGSLRDLAQFLDYLSSVENRGLIVSGSGNSDAVNIMSIHKSKGLEFPVVFLCNLSRRFNQESLRAQILCDKELGLGLSVADPQRRIRYPSAAKRAISVKMASESVSEEMRVLYVAMTRAKDRLIMTYASQSLKSDLEELVTRQAFDGGELLCQDATCLGDWVLLAALQRTEAGQLHAFAGKPKETHIGVYPWKIAVTETPVSFSEERNPQKACVHMADDVTARIHTALTYQYPHLAATHAPSKQTATDRKGRDKDAEAAENAPEARQPKRNWRRPAFLSAQKEGTAYGNAMHTVLQYISYEKCADKEGICAEINRLVEQRFLTEEQQELVDPQKLHLFFSTDIGKKLQRGIPHLREFKFSILDSGKHYDAALEEEQVLLQGVVDCAILENDGITVIDFKTDYVIEETLPDTVRRYQPQVRTYADALARIYEMPIKAQYLYFFRLDRFVEI